MTCRRPRFALCRPVGKARSWGIDCQIELYGGAFKRLGLARGETVARYETLYMFLGRLRHNYCGLKRATHNRWGFDWEVSESAFAKCMALRLLNHKRG